MSVVSFSMENVTSEGTSELLAVIQLVYGIPSFILMIFFVVFLLAHKGYSNSFYRVVVMDLITNIFLYSNSWIALRLDGYPFGVMVMKTIENAIPGFVTFSKFLTNYFLHAQFCSAISLSIHRISSVIWPTKSEKWWLKWYPIYFICCLLYSCLPILIPWPGISYSISIENGVLMRSRNFYATSINSTKIGVYSTIYFFLILAVGLSTSTLVTRKMKAVSVSDKGIGKKLTRIALTYTAVYSGILLWSDLNTLNSKFNFFPQSIIQFNTVAMVFASDLMTLALPYILLIFDTNIRKDVIRKNRVTPSGTRQITSTSFMVVT